MPAFQNLPWLNSSDQFLRAITAGADLASQRESRALQAALAERPRFNGGGGGHFFTPPAPQVQQTPQANPNDPHFNLQGTILSLVDPARQAAPPANPQPFEAGGSRFITNPSTDQPELYSPPSRLEKVGNDLVQITEDKTSGTPFTPGVPKFGVQKLYEGGNPTSDRVNQTTIDTTGMTPDQVTMASMFNPPRLSGSPAAISNYLATAKSPQLPPKPTARIRVKSPDGKIGTISEANLKEALSNGYTEVK